MNQSNYYYADIEKRFIDGHPDSPEALIVSEIIMDILKADTCKLLS